MNTEWNTDVSYIDCFLHLRIIWIISKKQIHIFFSLFYSWSFFFFFLHYASEIILKDEDFQLDLKPSFTLKLEEKKIMGTAPHKLFQHFQKIILYFSKLDFSRCLGNICRLEWKILALLYIHCRRYGFKSISWIQKWEIIYS